MLDCISVVYLVRNRTEWFAIASQFNPINRTHVQVTFWISKNLYFVSLNKCSLFIIKHNSMVSIKENPTFSLGIKGLPRSTGIQIRVLYRRIYMAFVTRKASEYSGWITNLRKKDMIHLQGKLYLLRQGRMILMDQILSDHGEERPGWVTEWQCWKASVFIQ
jgi:hypothetical protein